MRLPRCPVCKREIAEGASKSFPFCSPRCKMVDLGRWLGESYSVPHVGGDDEEDPDEPPTETRRRPSEEDDE